jgi:hypothetical protein
MGAPKSLTGLVASIEVETRDWHACLSAVRKHAGPKDDLPLLICGAPSTTWSGWIGSLLGWSR